MTAKAKATECFVRFIKEASSDYHYTQYTKIVCFMATVYYKIREVVYRMYKFKKVLRNAADSYFLREKHRVKISGEGLG